MWWASFTSMAAPTLANPQAMARMTVASQLKVQFSDNSEQSFDLGYQPFFVTGDEVSDGKGGKILAGGYYDINNNKIIDRTVAGSERHFFSDSPDGTSLLTVPNAKVDGVKGKPVFAVVQFEYTTWAQDGKTDMYGKLPSPIAVLTLDQDQTTGKLSLVKYHNVDTSKVHGLWITCGASLSPWGTHLSSEEYEPDAFATGNAQLLAFSQNLYGDQNKANPYHYGHMPEVTVNVDGTASIKKHFCMGRISHELVQVMPDQRTALMGDDATNSGYFVFVADKEKGPVLGFAVRGQGGRGLLHRPRIGQRRRADLDQAGLGHQRRDRAAGQHAQAHGHHDRGQDRSGRRQLHQDHSQRQGGVDQDQPWHGQGCRLPGNPPLRRLQGAQAWASPRWKARPSTPRTRWPTRPCRTAKSPWWPVMR